jgi:hypothetical protein
MGANNGIDWPLGDRGADQWSIPRLGIPRLKPGEECAVTRGRSRYPPLRGMNSTYKYYGAAFVIFEFHSFDLQTSVADDL